MRLFRCPCVEYAELDSRHILLNDCGRRIRVEILNAFLNRPDDPHRLSAFADVRLENDWKIESLGMHEVQDGANTPERHGGWFDHSETRDTRRRSKAFENC